MSSHEGAILHDIVNEVFIIRRFTIGGALLTPFVVECDFGDLADNTKATTAENSSNS